MSLIVRLIRALPGAFFAFMLAQSVVAQGVTTGAISGKVSDDEGQPLGGATVEITHRPTGYRQSTTTRSNGVYLVQGLEVGGPYSVAFRMIGYEPFARENVVVELSQTTRVDALLARQAIQLTGVDVNAPVTADFSPTRTGVGTDVSERLIERTPALNRDVVDLLKLAPQVVYPSSGAASGGGAYNRFNTFTVDGANQSERFNLGSSGGVPGAGAGGRLLSQDAVKEFRVLFTPTDVRQGSFVGMLMNAVTKSGTNEFHGGANFTYRSNETFLGVELVGEPLRASQFDAQQYGFFVGGPIIRDRLHFFVAPEWQQEVSPTVDPVGSIPQDSAALISSIMQNTYGFDVGTFGPIDEENPLRNFFGRIDFQISPAHRMVLRQIYNRADEDEFFRDLDAHNPSPTVQTQGFRFGTQSFARASINSSTVAQLYSNFGGGKSNELIVGYNTIEDERIVPAQAPEVSVGVNMGGTRRAATFGTEQFSPDNLLEQKIFEIVNNFTLPLGAHTVTLGGRFDHSNILNNFAQASYGVWKFDSIPALQAGTPTGYLVAYANSRNPADIAAQTSVNVFSLYGQDQWAVNDRLTITAGLRADIPRMLDQPLQNNDLMNALADSGLAGLRTDATPKTQVMWSPRVGFNLNTSRNVRSQLRGSAGIFTGPPPYIMLLNAYQNTGLQLVRASCTGTAPVGGTPTFTMDVSQLPLACRGQPDPAAGQAGTVGVNVNDPNFKFPQYYAFSAGFDRQLPLDMVLTVEGMYRKAKNGVLVRDLNIKGPRVVGGEHYRDRYGRVLYMDTVSASGAATTNTQRYMRSYKGVTFSEGIIQASNQSKDYNYSLSVQLNRRFSERFDATLAYTYMVSKDVQSLTSDRAISNWRNGRQLSGAHEELETATSVFSRPHRFLAYGTFNAPWQSTSITFFYERTSGTPISYVASGDLNGDGYNGNDLIYIPRDAADTNEIKIGTGVNTSFAPNPNAVAAFNRFISGQDCLDKQRGKIMERGSCRSPAIDRLDLSIRQALPAFRGHQISIQLDFFNFLNFLNEDWGIQKLPTLSPTFVDQRALIQTGRNAATTAPLNDPRSIPTFTFDNGLWQSDPTKQDYGAPYPFEGRVADRVYSIQLSMRYNF
jgi:hypothetical protein